MGAASGSGAGRQDQQNLPQVTRLFASDRLEDALAGAGSGGEATGLRASCATLRSKSPLSCKVSLRLLAEGADRASFADEMRAEYALAGRVVRTHDFEKGCGRC